MGETNFLIRRGIVWTGSLKTTEYRNFRHFRHYFEKLLRSIKKNLGTICTKLTSKGLKPEFFLSVFNNGAHFGQNIISGGVYPRLNGG